ncbi:unnamed protein product [Chondrus crispus]|uniref:Uncharacterized protein n=1 Tax=Chondrus crispus TaxID=2769 RepID=R7QNP3_CHOCR|nr:unnamed protein product [Chondrus crispus]CDF39403.1 unnamed protein product [Chondrus crispus]|eukprot:XP_005719314.1 unnamed protein product [Chondrus crispus]
MLQYSWSEFQARASANENSMERMPDEEGHSSFLSLNLDHSQLLLAYLRL